MLCTWRFPCPPVNIFCTCKETSFLIKIWWIEKYYSTLPSIRLWDVLLSIKWRLTCKCCPVEQHAPSEWDSPLPPTTTVCSGLQASYSLMQQSEVQFPNVHSQGTRVHIIINIGDAIPPVTEPHNSRRHMGLKKYSLNSKALIQNHLGWMLMVLLLRVVLILRLS